MKKNALFGFLKIIGLGNDAHRVKIKCWVKNAIKEFTSLGSNLKLHFGFVHF